MDHLTGRFPPELLAPAGDREKLETALAYGADAVYLGGPRHNLRAGARGFSWEELGGVLEHIRACGRKAYFCLNALPTEGQLPEIEAELERAASLAVDGLIVADPGVLRLAGRLAPQLPVHLSTQANTSNSQGVRFWQDQGIRRINLARELSWKEIQAVRQACPDIELEVFVHGAMCLAQSGKCHLSAYLNNRSANQGGCSHPCRFDYRVQAVALEEAKRPGKITWEVRDDEERHSALLASDDLCLIEHLSWFAANRIEAVKIEGRTKSSTYLAVVLDAYRTALSDLQSGRFSPEILLAELAESAGRPLSTGFFLPEGRRRVLEPTKRRLKPVVGRIEAQLTEDCWLIAVKHRWSGGRPLELLLPGLQRPLLRGEDYRLEDEAGQPLETVHSGQTVRLRSACEALQPGCFLRLAGSAT